MQLVLRDRGPDELIRDLRGKKVVIWTCNTCARLCDLGGQANAERLAGRLRSGGVDVVDVRSVKASCLIPLAEAEVQRAVPDCEVVLALACDVGSRVAGEVLGVPVLNPVVTLGAGYLRGDGTPVLAGRSGSPEETIGEISARAGLPSGPFV